jgi:molecular chaperone DnaK (HSP70)
VLRQAKCTWDQIDRVLLVGGSTRMPMVGQTLEQLSGKAPDRSMSPDEAVAHGAALYAARLTPEDVSLSSEFELINVNSHSLGIIGIDQREKRYRNITIIPKNTPLPCKVVKKFATARENQSSVRVVVVEGESERPEHCRSALTERRILLSPIPPPAYLAWQWSAPLSLDRIMRRFDRVRAKRCTPAPQGQTFGPAVAGSGKIARGLPFVQYR